MVVKVAEARKEVEVVPVEAEVAEEVEVAEEAEEAAEAKAEPRRRGITTTPALAIG